jgi:hypothetical protein
MSAGWVAASVRGRSLARRGLGSEAARSLAAADYATALDTVCHSVYGHDVRPDMDLPSATRALWSSALWHLRILAGWGPPLGAGAVRTMAGGFELANIDGLLLSLAGGSPPAPFVLGSLARAWPAASACTSLEALRRVLAGSPWGDPDSDDPGVVRLVLRITWACRVLDEAPGAEDWAVSAVVLLMARAACAGAVGMLPPRARRDVARVLGHRSAAATTLQELRASAPRAAQRMLEPVRSAEDLWLAEAVWWRATRDGARALARRPVAAASVSVAAAALLAADAWEVAAALQLAARAGTPSRELLDALG